MKQETVQNDMGDWKRREKNLEFQRNIIAGHIIRKLPKQEGSYGYLVQLLEPYLEKKSGRLFGLPF